MKRTRTKEETKPWREEMSILERPEILVPIKLQSGSEGNDGAAEQLLAERKHCRKN